VAAFKRAIKAHTHTGARKRKNERERKRGGEMEILGSEMLNARAHITTTRGHWLLHLHSRQELKALSRVFRGKSGERSEERRIGGKTAPPSHGDSREKEMRDSRARCQSEEFAAAEEVTPISAAK